MCIIYNKCYTNSKKEEKSEGTCIKHKIIEEVGFMWFLECVKNLNRLKGKHVFKATEQGNNDMKMNTILYISSALMFLVANNRKSNSEQI